MANFEESYEYAHDKLEEGLSEAKLAGQELKRACSQAIDTVIADIIAAIKHLEGTPLPVKGFFARLQAKISKHRNICKLQAKIPIFEKVKNRVEATFLDSYRDADKLTEYVAEKIRHYAPEGSRSEELRHQLLGTKRAFREKILLCAHDLDLELDKLRDFFTDTSKKANVKQLMWEGSFSDIQKLSHLESLNNQGKLLANPPEPAPSIPAAPVVAAVAAESVVERPELSHVEEEIEHEPYLPPVSHVEEVVAAPTVPKEEDDMPHIEEPMHELPPVSHVKEEIPPTTFHEDEDEIAHEEELAHQAYMPPANLVEHEEIGHEDEAAHQAYVPPANLIEHEELGHEDDAAPSPAKVMTPSGLSMTKDEDDPFPLETDSPDPDEELTPPLKKDIASEKELE